MQTLPSKSQSFSSSSSPQARAFLSAISVRLTDFNVLGVEFVEFGLVLGVEGFLAAEDFPLGGESLSEPNRSISKSFSTRGAGNQMGYIYVTIFWFYEINIQVF